MQNLTKFLFEFLFSLFVFSLFLLVGGDRVSQVTVRMVYGGVLLFSSLLYLKKQEETREKEGSFACFAFLCFFIFELLRFLTAVFQTMVSRYPEPALLLRSYLTSPFSWSFYLGFFTLSYQFYRERKRLERLLWLFAGSGFFLAFCAIPPLLTSEELGYRLFGNVYWFFPSFFYSHPLLKEYVFGGYGNVNYIGDLMGLGFFPAAGLFFYQLYRLGERRLSNPIASLGLPACLAGAVILAVTLILSRGTILSFSLALFVYLALALLKFPSRSQFLFTGAVLLLVSFFLVSGGHLGRMWKELQTIRGEADPAKESSFSENREGAKRALGIFRDYPLRGVGTGGYALVSERYASPGSETLFNAKVRAMNHYLQTLAEEGVGAFLYFLFLLAYFFEVMRGLWRVGSRFQFMAGLSLFSSVFMVLIHASIHFLMQQFSISLLVYILMGATLGVLREDHGTIS